MNLKSRVESLEQSERYRPPAQPIAILSCPDEDEEPEEYRRIRQLADELLAQGRKVIVLTVAHPRTPKAEHRRQFPV